MTHTIEELKEEFLQSLRDHTKIIEENISNDDYDLVQKRLIYLLEVDYKLFKKEITNFRIHKSAGEMTRCKSKIKTGRRCKWPASLDGYCIRHYPIKDEKRC